VSIGSGERLTAEPTLATITKTAQGVATLVNEMRTTFAAGAEGLSRIGGPWCRYCPQLDACEEGAAAVRVADS
ncbi:MAG: hypothetical protein GY722_21190, partial [bacterium]|nr:hypothetical protein [bacterium]